MKNNIIIKLLFLFIIVICFIQFLNKTNSVIEGNYSRINNIISRKDELANIELNRRRNHNLFCCIDKNRPVVASQLKITKNTCKDPNSDLTCDTDTYTQTEIDELESGTQLEACKIPPPLDQQGHYSTNIVPISSLNDTNSTRQPSKTDIEVGDEVTYITSKSNIELVGIVFKIDKVSNKYYIKAIDSNIYDIIKKKHIRNVDIGMFKSGDYLYDYNYKPFDYAYYNKDTKVCSYPAPQKISTIMENISDMYNKYYSPPSWFLRTNVCSVNGKICDSSTNPSEIYKNPNKVTHTSSSVAHPIIL